MMSDKNKKKIIEKIETMKAKAKSLQSKLDATKREADQLETKVNQQ